jgi:hypothetical protein
VSHRYESPRRGVTGLRAFLSSPPPARASVSSATQRAHCPPTNCTHLRPDAPPPPNRPALLAFPPPLPTGRTCEHKAEHAGPPTAESLPEQCKREPWPPPSCRSPLSPHPHPLVVTGHLTSSPPPVLRQSQHKHKYKHDLNVDPLDERPSSDQAVAEDDDCLSHGDRPRMDLYVRESRTHG